MAETLRKCEWCGKPVVPKSNRGPKPKYCKASCRQRAYELRCLAKLLDGERS